MGLVLANVHHRGIRFGPSFANLEPLPEIKDGIAVAEDVVHEAFDMESIPHSGGWDSDSRVCLRAQAPRPATVLGIVVPTRTSEKT